MDSALRYCIGEPAHSSKRPKTEACSVASVSTSAEQFHERARPECRNRLSLSAVRRAWAHEPPSTRDIVFESAAVRAQTRIQFSKLTVRDPAI